MLILDESAQFARRLSQRICLLGPSEGVNPSYYNILNSIEEILMEDVLVKGWHKLCHGRAKFEYPVSNSIKSHLCTLSRGITA